MPLTSVIFGFRVLSFSEVIEVDEVSELSIQLEQASLCWVHDGIQPKVFAQKGTLTRVRASLIEYSFPLTVTLGQLQLEALGYLIAGFWELVAFRHFFPEECKRRRIIAPRTKFRHSKGGLLVPSMYTDEQDCYLGFDSPAAPLGMNELLLTCSPILE